MDGNFSSFKISMIFNTKNPQHFCPKLIEKTDSSLLPLLSNIFIFDHYEVMMTRSWAVGKRCFFGNPLLHGHVMVMKSNRTIQERN